jgi:hypothetical protein
VDPTRFELVASAMRERHEGLHEFSGVCKTPANGSILMRVHFSAFQEIYSGCCTVYAQIRVPTKRDSLASLRRTKPRPLLGTFR